MTPTLKLLTTPTFCASTRPPPRSGEVLHSGDMIAWDADLPADLPANLPAALRPAPRSDAAGATTALALFNTGDTPETITTSFAAYHLDAMTYRVTDAWSGKSLGKIKSIENLTIEPHDSVLWLLKK